MARTYAGIGSRETPQDVLALMVKIGRCLAERGWTLRSGAADGADAAFERGAVAASGSTEIWLPWRGFQYHRSTLLPSQAAFEMAAQFHPAWERCSRGARALHARNCHQVLGANLDDPVDMVVCWTRYGRRGGGTGQALRIAEARNIPIFDLAVEGSERALRTFVDQA